MSTVLASLKEFEKSLPTVPAPVANYVPYVIVKASHTLFTSGVLPVENGEVLYQGQLKAFDDVEKGKHAARLACINALSVVNAAIGGLDKITRIVKLTGFVSSDPHFTDQPLVMNGASDLLVEVFGEIGKHARSAVGVAALPKNASVELELIVEIAP